ncbi:hypothetical protein C5B96_15350 [Subtercola sp. Z020]|nr:hypothetical protein C5B96_15350 [Subtercola sp. Z020]
MDDRGSDAGAETGAGTASASAAPPSASASAVPTEPGSAGSAAPTSGAQSAAQPGAPFDPDEAAAWTTDIARQMLGSREPGALEGSAGHLDDATSQNRVERFLSLPAGDYSYAFACRGGGEVTLGVATGAAVGDGSGDLGTESPLLAGSCSGQILGGDFTAEEGGTEFRLRASGAAVDYVLRYGAPIAR